MNALLPFASVVWFAIAGSVPAGQPGEPAHYVGGLWTDNARRVLITQDGNLVIGQYLEAYDCDHRDGTDEHSQTEIDFRATLDGDSLQGETATCRFGEGNNPGIEFATMVLVVNGDDTELRGSWVGSVDRGAITIVRTGCPGQLDINARLSPLRVELQALIAGLPATAAQALSQALEAEGEELLPEGSAAALSSSLQTAIATLGTVQGQTAVQFFNALGDAVNQAQALASTAEPFAPQAPTVLDFLSTLQRLHADQARATADIAADQELQQTCGR